MPSIAAVGALGLLLVAGRRWMGAATPPRPRLRPQPLPLPQKPTTVADDDDYADKLDDELSRTE